MNFEVTKVQAWIGVALVLGGLVVTFADLFTTSKQHETRIAKLESAEEKRAAEQKTRDEAAQATLNQIKESVNFANWNIGAINEKLKEKKR